MPDVVSVVCAMHDNGGFQRICAYFMVIDVPASLNAKTTPFATVHPQRRIHLKANCVLSEMCPRDMLSSGVTQ